MIYFYFLLWLDHGQRGLWLAFNNSNLIVVQILLQLLILAGDKLKCSDINIQAVQNSK